LRAAVEGDGIGVPEPPTREALLAFIERAERRGNVLAYGEEEVATRPMLPSPPDPEHTCARADSRPWRTA
jgi:hypothetical protein